MKKFIWILGIMCITPFLKSQKVGDWNPTLATVDWIHQQIKTSSKPIIIQFWIPNCANSAEILTQYNEMIQNHGNVIDFYFIGITNSDTLFGSKLKNNPFLHKNYFRLDNQNHQELIRCKQEFCFALCHRMNLKKSDFLTLCVPKNKTKSYTTNDIEITKKMIKKILKF